MHPGHVTNSRAVIKQTRHLGLILTDAPSKVARAIPAAASRDQSHSSSSPHPTFGVDGEEEAEDKTAKAQHVNTVESATNRRTHAAKSMSDAFTSFILLGEGRFVTLS